MNLFIFVYNLLHTALFSPSCLYIAVPMVVFIVIHLSNTAKRSYFFNENVLFSNFAATINTMPSRGNTLQWFFCKRIYRFGFTFLAHQYFWKRARAFFHIYYTYKSIWDYIVAASEWETWSIFVFQKPNIRSMIIASPAKVKRSSFQLDSQCIEENQLTLSTHHTIHRKVIIIVVPNLTYIFRFIFTINTQHNVWPPQFVSRIQIHRLVSFFGLSWLHQPSYTLKLSVHFPHE